MIEALRRFLGRGEPPVPVVQDAQLGTLTWSQDWEAWLGEHGKRTFSLAYGWSSLPTAAVRGYAYRVLTRESWLEESLVRARAEALSKYPPFYTSEIASLTLGTLHFSVHRKRGEYLLADLDGGRDYRLWRLEFSGDLCRGIGFDN